MGGGGSKLSGGALLLAIALVLILNSAYLAAFGSPTLFYILNSFLHPALGIIAVVLLALFVARHRPAFRNITGSITLALLLPAGIFGIYLAVAGMTRPHSLALYLHVGFAVAGLFFLWVFLRARARESKVASTGNAGDPGWRLAANWSAGVIAASLTFYAAAVLAQHYFPNPRYIIRNPRATPIRMEEEGAGPNSLLFPSSARTSDGKPIKSTFFMNSEACQRCHPDIYAQWQSSMHHFASFNNQWYRKSIEYMQDTIGIKPSLWCGGCHDHALVIAGQMQTRPIREIEDTPAGQNGLGCMSCHAIVHVDSTMGQGGFTFEYPKLAELAESRSHVLRWLHDYQVRLDPKPHRNAFLKPFHRDRQQVAEYCSVCHKVHLDVPVNHYRWLRGFNDYDNWQASGVSGQGARSFYYPPKPMVCVDCHMPLEPSKDMGNIAGMVHSHRFPAANTAVPASNGDTAQVKAVERFIKGALSVDIFALAEEPASEAESSEPSAANSGVPQLSSSFAAGEESSTGMTAQTSVNAAPVKLIAPLGRAAASLYPAQTARVEVVVRTRKLGHFFPGGTVDAFDVWLELQARDSKGKVIFWSGETANNGSGPVDPGAHFYRSLQLDAHGNMINKRNAWSTRATLYARLIPPGAADTVHFRLKVPKDSGDRITLTAKLNYRKFSWIETQFAFAGVRDLAEPHPDVTSSYDDGHWLYNGDTSHVSARYKQIADVPTVVVAEDTKIIPVAASRSAGLAAFDENIKLDAADWERWNDYGIGLLLQGDLKGAERAFSMVTQVAPKYADGYVNVARARVQEGNTEAAKPMLEKALSLNPKLGSAHYFTGLALKADGDYSAAYDEFAKAATRYPNDRVNRNQMGRMLFLQRQYHNAVDQYQKTLAIDPEDLEAHYNLMLCYRGLEDDAKASLEEKLYLRFKADEASKSITGPRILKHPEDNNEAQSVHEHDSIALEPAAIFQAYQGMNVSWAWPEKEKLNPHSLVKAASRRRKHPLLAGTAKF